MSTNKNAIVPYHALDRCFSNFWRRFFIEDLIEACNEALTESTGVSEGVKRRQVFDDIAFMESEQGWSIPLERLKEGKRVYYRYSDRSFMIRGMGVNQGEAEQIKETLSILGRFKGLPHFEWLEEIQIRLVDAFHLSSTEKPIVSFEQNPYLRGLQQFGELYQAIQNKEALVIQYQGFKESTPKTFQFHPWYLKQYNNRWFLLGKHQDFESVANLSIDRIVSSHNANCAYIENQSIDFDEYFDDVVGVSVKPGLLPSKVELRINPSLWPYIETKPLHGSQRVQSRSEAAIIVQIEVQVNHELIALLFSYMDGIEVIAPDELRMTMRTRSEAIASKYF